MLICTISFCRRNGRAVVCFLPEGEVSFDPVEDIDHGVTGVHRHADKGFLANCLVYSENLLHHRPSGRSEP